MMLVINEDIRDYLGLDAIEGKHISRMADGTRIELEVVGPRRSAFSRSVVQHECVGFARRCRATFGRDFDGKIGFGGASCPANRRACASRRPRDDVEITQNQENIPQKRKSTPRGLPFFMPTNQHRRTFLHFAKKNFNFGNIQ
jgi:hypothetical protein